jgi:hypothetical protein
MVAGADPREGTVAAAIGLSLAGESAELLVSPL